jgi:DNA-binding transcriptional regulator GbsR (MarR family)
MARLQQPLSVSTEGSATTGDLHAMSVDFFVSFVQVFGLPKSIGQIYGLLFVSADPLPMDDIVTRLGISKGSASQGLALLKSLGAVTSRTVPSDRREHFEADLNVSRIVTHFFENRLQPRLEHGDRRLEEMLDLARAAKREKKDGGSAAVLTRIQALQKWQKRGRNLLPMVVRWLKR